MKKTLFLSVFLCAFMLINAGTLTGRVAYVGDGNFRDADDIAANPISIAMFHMFGKADKVVHYTYACHDVTSLAGREAKLKAGIDGAIAKWGALPNAQIFNYKSQKNEAISNLTAAINASSAADLLWIIEAGEPDLIYLAMNAAEEAKRQYVKIVTHHPNNDVGVVYDLSHIMALTGVPSTAKVDIPDQNTNLKKPLADYNWLNTHSEAKVKFLWEQGNIAEQDADYSGIRTYFDPSDAGMAWYVLTGGSVDGGDNACTVAKLQAKINAYTSSTTNPPTTTPDIVFIQSEHTTSPLGQWEKIVPGNASFVTGAKNDTTLMFNGNNPAGQGSAVSPLTYTFKAPNNGTYKLITYATRILLGEAFDKCNDFYVRLEGDFEAGAGSYTTAQLKANMKYYFSYGGDNTSGRRDKIWIWAEQGDLAIGGVDVKKPLYYTLKAGQTYTLTISGRSQRAIMDYIMLYNTATVTDAVAKAYYPGNTGGGTNDCLTINYNQWDLSKPVGYVAQGSLDATRTAVQIVTTTAGYTDQWAAAKYTYTGTAGNFTMKFTSLQETDGESFYKVLINGVEKLSFQNPRIHGTTVADYTPYEKEVLNISLNPNDVIQVDYKSHSNGLVPEGTAFGYSRARWRSVSLCSASVVGPQAPIASIVIPTLPVCSTTPLSVTVKGTDADGTIKSVELIVNGVSKGVQNSSTYTYDLGTGVAGETYSLEAKVVDNTDMIGVKTGSFKVETDCSAPIKITACAATASIVQSPNNAENVLDGNLSTRWAGLGVGATLTLDLCNEVTVSKVKISFYSGNSRSYKFDLQISSDNVNFSPLSSGLASSGTTTEMEEFTFSSVTGRYLRYVGQGNSTSLWSSIYEMEVLAKVEANGISNISNSKNHIVISPNPARNEFFVNTSGITAKQISIKNALGAEVFNQALDLQQNNKFIVNKNLKSGIYFVLITDNNNKVYSDKLIIQ